MTPFRKREHVALLEPSYSRTWISTNKIDTRNLAEVTELYGRATDLAKTAEFEEEAKRLTGELVDRFLPSEEHRTGVEWLLGRRIRFGVALARLEERLGLVKLDHMSRTAFYALWFAQQQGGSDPEHYSSSAGYYLARRGQRDLHHVLSTLDSDLRLVNERRPGEIEEQILYSLDYYRRLGVGPFRSAPS
jgi:hypothetical protein